MWNSAYSSTISNSIACSKVFIACLVHYRERLSRNLSGEIPELTISWYWISRTVPTNPLVDHGSIPFRAGFQWSCSSLWSHSIPYIVIWPSVHLKINELTCNHILRHIRAGYGFGNHLGMWTLCPICAGCIDSVVVNYLGCALLLRFTRWQIQPTACHLALFRSTHNCLRSVWGHDLLLWNRWRRR
jgi:hypothetical protein